MGKNWTGSGSSENIKQNSASDGFIEPDEIGDKLETAAIRQPFDECVQHCECFIPCKSSEHCANHNLATKCCPCCEHCAGALQLFQQRKPSDKQFHFEPDELAVNSEGFGQYEMSEFVPEFTDRLKLIQLYNTSSQQHECFESEPDTSIKDSEQCSMNGFTINISYLVDSLDCDGKHCEHVEKRNQSESSDDGESDTAEVNEAEPIDRELARFSHFDAPAHIYFDGREVSECCKTYQLTEGNYQWVNMSSSLPDKASDSSTEEDSSSDCSSVETKSFKTCSEGSVPSDPCTNSSGESDKGAQEDSSDEQTQWESFEDEEEIEQCHINGVGGNRPKTPSTDVILEDYFDLFDRSEYYGHTFLQKQPYISCFDGGDIHAHLYLEEVQSQVQKPARNAYKCNEVNEEPEVQEPDILGEACEEENLRDDTSPGTEKQTDDWIIKSDSYIAEDMSEHQEEGENEVCGFFNCVPKTCDGAIFALFSANGENMFAPFANDITVEIDAYEDEFRYEQNYESPAEDTSVTGRSLIDCKIEEKEDEEFIACSEMEPYWSLLDHEEGDPGVEEYYAYHIKSIQSCMKQNMNGVDKTERSQHQLTPERINVDASWEEGDTVLSPKKTELSTNPHTSPEECNAIRLESTQLLTAKSDDDSDSTDSPQKLNPPSDIIHSVVSELANGEEEDTHDASEQYRDSEEEPFDDESSEFCECEYCIPPEEQIPIKPLLPQIKSNDAGKICVVIDLDETLVHSSFKPVHNADFIIPVEIDGTVHQVYVMKRPHVDAFLKRMGELFECVLFTASLSKYADPVSDQLDKGGAFRSRLFRESCVFHKGNYVKDLSRLGRDLRQVIIIDNSPASYYFHPENAVPVVSWFDDMSDTELLDLIPFFERLSKVDDIFTFLTEQRTSG